MFNYFKEVRGEMKHVSWPTRQMVVVYTAVVIGVSLCVAIYLGLLDFIFSSIITGII
jgi:preprotein translocase subunit SecE